MDDLVISGPNETPPLFLGASSTDSCFGRLTVATPALQLEHAHGMTHRRRIEVALTRITRLFDAVDKVYVRKYPSLHQLNRCSDYLEKIRSELDDFLPTLDHLLQRDCGLSAAAVSGRASIGESMSTRKTLGRVEKLYERLQVLAEVVSVRKQPITGRWSWAQCNKRRRTSGPKSVGHFGTCDSEASNDRDRCVELEPGDDCRSQQEMVDLSVPALPNAASPLDAPSLPLGAIFDAVSSPEDVSGPAGEGLSPIIGEGMDSCKDPIPAAGLECGTAVDFARQPTVQQRPERDSESGGGVSGPVLPENPPCESCLSIANGTESSEVLFSDCRQDPPIANGAGKRFRKSAPAAGRPCSTAVPQGFMTKRGGVGSRVDTTPTVDVSAVTVGSTRSAPNVPLLQTGRDGGVCFRPSLLNYLRRTKVLLVDQSELFPNDSLPPNFWKSPFQDVALPQEMTDSIDKWD